MDHACGPSAAVLGRNLLRLRRALSKTQEQLAEEVGVTPQAVSRWERGQVLPETAQLYALSCALGQSMDVLLQPDDLRLCSAVCSDGETCVDVLARAELYLSPRGSLPPPRLAPAQAAGDGRWLLALTYETPAGRFAAACALSDPDLTLSGGAPLPASGLQVLACRYGGPAHARDGMGKIAHYDYFSWNGYPATHEAFPVDVQDGGPFRLVIAYANSRGASVAACAEGETLAFSEDRNDLARRERGGAALLAVPPLAWQKGQDCTFGGAMAASLACMGVDAPYEQVMGRSGACYRLAFCAPKWDYSSVDGLVSYDFFTPLKKAFGLQAEIVSRVSGAEREAARARILQDLRDGRPTAAINLRVAPEWGVICGCLADGTLLCRSYFDEDTRRAQADNRELQAFLAAHEGCFPVDNWPFLLIRFCRPEKPMDASAACLASLATFVDCMNAPGRGYHSGWAAYDAWSSGLCEDAFFRDAPPEDGRRRQSVHHFCLMALADARAAAHAYLASCLPLLADAGAELSAMADAFARSAAIAAGMLAEVSDGYHEPHKPFTADVRHRHAAALLQMKALEQGAQERARTLLARAR